MTAPAGRRGKKFRRHHAERPRGRIGVEVAHVDDADQHLDAAKPGEQVKGDDGLVARLLKQKRQTIPSEPDRQRLDGEHDYLLNRRHLPSRGAEWRSCL
jgi:hypothetical protein